MSQKLISKMLSGKVVYSDKASMRTASRAADDLNDPREIQRIVAEQDKAREAEQKLNQALE